MTIEQIIKSLSFNSYAANRLRSPEIAPERWGKIYGEKQVKAFEAALQAEQEIFFDKMKKAEKISWHFLKNPHSQNRNNQIIKTMNKNTIKEFIKSTKGAFFSVKYTKADGSIRSACGKSFNKQALVGGESTHKESNSVPYWDVNKKAYRSFRADSVLEISCGKRSLIAQI